MNQQFRMSPQVGFNFDELIVDNFAGGGGASTGIEAAMGRPVDIAINHSADAIAMHEVNHPGTRHYCESVWDIDPRKVCRDRPVGLAWFSPDCKHFSKAAGGKPVEKKIRGLAWVAVRWAATVKPRIIMLENVEEFVTWGPVVDGLPCKQRKGKTFASFVNALRSLGYEVDTAVLRACNYGAPTIRKRFFLVARRDGEAIRWPEPTHGDPKSDEVKSGKLLPWLTAADIIDWSIPCPSIFERKRPLAENTLRRIARGLEKFVFNSAEPFIVRIGQTGFGGDGLQYPIDKPLTTVTSKAEHCLVMPVVARQFGKSVGHSIDDPLGTVTSGGGGKSQLITAFVAKHFGGVTGVRADTPFPTITMTGSQNQIVTSHLVKLRGTCQHGQPITDPMPTVTASGLHVGEVRAFLIKYYGTNIGLRCDEPLHTVPTKDRFGLVTIQGEDYQIIDIGMRMLQPHELFAAQGFSPDYIIDRDASGKRITKTAQVARCGNSVCPPIAEALVRANMTADVAKELVA
jgi:DNA (cytosine-5)-methyltransferase 1